MAEEEDGEGGFTRSFRRNTEDPVKYHLQIISASNLMKKDIFGASDPYVKVMAQYHSPSSDEIRKTEVAKTRTIKNELNPIWSEAFNITLNSELDFILDFFLLEVWDENRLIRDDFLGQVEIKPEHCTSQESMILTLERRSENSRVSGTIKIACYQVQEDIATVEDIGRTPLPEGWEERRDNNGRAYYFDHNTRTTQLERPEFEVGGMVSNRSSNSLRDDFLERRTISMEDALTEVEETPEMQAGGDPWWLEPDPFLENDEGVWSGSQSVDAEPESPDSALPQESQDYEGSEPQADSSSDTSPFVGGTRHLGAGAQHAHSPSWYARRGLDPERHARRYERIRSASAANEQAAANATTDSVESVCENNEQSTEAEEDVVADESEGRETAEQEDSVSASEEGAEEEANADDGEVIVEEAEADGEIEESELPEEEEDIPGEEGEDGDSGQEEAIDEEEPEDLSEQLPSAPSLASPSDAQLFPVSRTTPAMDDMIQERPLPPTPPQRTRRRPTSPLPAPPVPAHGIPLGGLATEREDTVDQPTTTSSFAGGTRHLGAGAQHAHTPSWYEARGLDPDRHERRNSNGRRTWLGQELGRGLDPNPHTSNGSSAPSAPSLPMGGIQPSERPHYPPPTNQSMAQPSPNSRRVPIGNNWDMMRTADNRVFFINHTTKTTTWVDPRLTLQHATRHDADQAVRRQDSDDPGPLPEGWEEKTLPNGKIYFIDHHTRRTTWEDPRFSDSSIAGKKVEYSQDYKYKYEILMRTLGKLDHGSNRDKFEITVKRENIRLDSFDAICRVDRHNVRCLRYKLWITFKGEMGLDYGGVSREWFSLLTTEIFNPYFGLFEYSAIDNYTLQINPHSGLCNEDHLQWFHFIGRVAGMAVFHKKLINGFFIRPFYSMMLGKTPTLKDMESVDIEYFNSLTWIKENDPSVLCHTFEVDDNVFGEALSKELIPNGADIEVSEENKMEYIRLVIEWRFVSRVRDQMDAFRRGFHDVIPFDAITQFDEGGLELLLGGIGTINVKDWRDNTVYKSYQPSDTVILWFWRIVLSFGDEMRHRLLQFVTGTSRVPMNGFAELYGSNGPQKFCIERAGSEDSLPMAHTCFNRLDLPPYMSYQTLKSKLVLAVEGSQGFDGVD